MLPTPLQLISNDLLKSKKINLYIKREDLNHPTIQGNKYRKLKYNLAAAKAEGKTTLLTFGGAFSNHIFAAAAAGKAFDFRTIGVIRGERIEPLNPTLAYAEANGMTLHFVSRSAYRNKENADFIEDLKQQFGDFYLLPEGGSNALAVKGCAEIVDEIEIDFDVICSAVGTGGTLAGLILGAKNRGEVLGFPALKGGDFLKTEIEGLLRSERIFNVVRLPSIFKRGVGGELNESKNENWQLITDYHFGGYAKFKPELIDFINDFKRQFDIQLEPIYTGKMLFGIFDLIQNDFFKPNTTIIAIHTGGLQGIEGFNERFGGILKMD